MGIEDRNRRSSKSSVNKRHDEIERNKRRLNRLFSRSSLNSKPQKQLKKDNVFRPREHRKEKRSFEQQ